MCKASARLTRGPGLIATFFCSILKIGLQRQENQHGKRCQWPLSVLLGPEKWENLLRKKILSHLLSLTPFSFLRVFSVVPQTIAATPLVAHVCGDPLSRYTCRATRVAADFLDFRAFCRCSTGVALHPLKILVSHLPPPWCRKVSHRNLGLKRCRATRGCRSYSCGCRATLCN